MAAASGTRNRARERVATTQMADLQSLPGAWPCVCISSPSYFSIFTHPDKNGWCGHNPVKSSINNIVCYSLHVHLATNQAQSQITGDRAANLFIHGDLLPGLLLSRQLSLSALTSSAWGTVSSGSAAPFRMSRSSSSTVLIAAPRNPGSEYRRSNSFL